ncbi:ATP synthase F1 subcomplex epsilon subunit [Desulfobotulus alkaliphilus]|uniref:ATP synthase epsilon chain n=1 Tax=Desulfobotulus alkaliphilus TaxID=622671 RepID=A0A562RI46_9BACT|nr:F0F1 ATP synthase subunit epsilon [Desulfobotulus alkaliphilus]TWI68224.1 ATP synthase F1 subcomplex epsilon subunit [Desulfobotulus alkaliphilus]
MAASIKLEIVTPEHVVVDEKVQTVVAPGFLGEFGVLPGHTSFLTSLKLGALRYEDTAGQTRYVFIKEGFAEVLPEKVTILAEAAERRKDIDVARAEASLERAKMRLEKKSREENIDFVRARAALSRSINRIRLATGQEPD